MVVSVGLDLGKGWIKAVEISSDLKLTNIGKIKLTEHARKTKKDEPGQYIAKIKALFDSLKLSRKFWNRIQELTGGR